MSIRPPISMSDGSSTAPRAGFSVVIPTLQRSPRLVPLLRLLVAHDLVGEVLVINNAPEPLPFEHDKVRVLDPRENIFVCPAWNLGAREAREPLLLLCNDDVSFDAELIDFAARILRWPVGIAAPDPRSVTRRKPSPIRWARPTYRRSYAFGILMAMRTDSYVPIPDDLLIACGDTFLFDRQQRRNVHIKGFRITTEMSTTSGHPEFSHQKLADQRAFHEHHVPGPYSQRFWLGHRLSMLEWFARDRSRGLRARLRGS